MQVQQSIVRAVRSAWVIDVREPGGGPHVRRHLHEGLLRIGRDRDCDIVLGSASVSRQHGQLEVRDGRLYYRDLNSFNGSMLNGRRVRDEIAIDAGSSVLEIGGYRIGIETEARHRAPARFTVLPDEEPPTRPMAPADLPARSAATRLLAQQIRGIRAHRDSRAQEQHQQRDQRDEQWAQMLDAARELQDELRANPGVQHFTISRDGEEITVKLSDRGKNGGFAYFILSRRNPDGQPRLSDLVWLREFGERDAHFDAPQAALDELVRRIASRLA